MSWNWVWGPKGHPHPHPTPIFSAYCIESDGSQTSQGKKREAFKVKKRERDYELLWVLFLKKIPRLWHGHLENGSMPIYSC